MDQPDLFPDITKESDDFSEEKSLGTDKGEPENRAKTLMESEPDGEDTRSRIRELESEIKAEREERRRLNDNMLKMMSMNEPAPKEVQEEDPPDPIDDPKAYAKWLRDSTVKAVSNETGRVKKELALQKKYEDLWTDFKDSYKDIAERHRGLVEYVASKKVRELSAAGMDVNNYIFNDSKRFMKDVANEVKGMIDIKEESETGSQEGLPSTTKSQTKRPPKKEEKEPMSFMEALREHRSKLYPLSPFPSTK